MPRLGNMKKPFSNPALAFVLLAFTLGVIYCIIIPYGAGFDEVEHITRIYDIAGNQPIPNRNPPNFKTTITLREFFDLSYQRRFIQSPAFDMYSPKNLSRTFNRQEENIVYGYQTRSIYSPVMFLPQALAARLLWRMADFPIFPGAMLVRLAGLGMYIALCYAAIRLLPFGKWLLTALALSPMAIYQAATLNADGYTNAVSFLFIGAALGAHASPEPKLGKQWILTLAGISILVGFAKPGLILLLPLLLLLNKQRFSTPWHLVLLGLSVALSVFANLGWTALAVDNSHLSSGGGQSISAQLSLIQNAPIEFVVSFIATTWRSLPTYFQNWAAAYGYWAGEVPGPVYTGYVTLLLAILLSEPATPKIPRNARLLLAGVFLLSSGATAGMYFVANYEPGMREVFGGQGRYFIPFAPLLFLAFSGLKVFPALWLRWLAAAAFALTMGFYTFGIYTTYYSYCGYAAYMGNPCSLPIYKNLNRETPEEVWVGPNIIHQTFTNQCSDLLWMDVLVKSVNQAKGRLQISVLGQNGQALASEQIPFKRIKADEYLAISLPTPGKKGEKFRLELRPLDTTTNNGVSFGINLVALDDIHLQVNQETLKGTLIFHYTCARP